MGRSRQDDVRSPRQKRSRDRVEQILNAARGIIAEQGSAGLTISDIAEKAGVTAASMYQYFPNKSAIIHALATEYLALLRQEVDRHLAVEVSSPEQMLEILTALMDRLYQMARRDRLLMDIWVGITSDRLIHEENAVEDARNLQAILAVAAPLFPAQDHLRLRETVILIYYFAKSSIRAMLALPEPEAADLMARAREMMRLMWESLSPPAAA